MSEAPERIWAWWDDTYDTGLVNTHGDKRYTPDDAREYVRAARIEELEAKMAKAVEALVRIADTPSEMTWGVESEVREAMNGMEIIAETTLAELTGGKDE